MPLRVRTHITLGSHSTHVSKSAAPRENGVGPDSRATPVEEGCCWRGKYYVIVTRGGGGRVFFFVLKTVQFLEFGVQGVGLSALVLDFRVKGLGFRV